MMIRQPTLRELCKRNNVPMVTLLIEHFSQNNRLATVDTANAMSGGGHSEILSLLTAAGGRRQE